MIKKLVSQMILGNVVQKVKTNKNFKDAFSDLQESIKNNGFQVKHIHDIKEAFDEKGLEHDSDFEYKLVQFCNAKKAHKALSMSTDVGIMMPKTIIIFRKNKETYFQFMKMKPFMVSLMFPEINLAPMSKNVMATMQKIITEAAI
jgi:uncharacterized protein (DUF302 family)